MGNFNNIDELNDQKKVVKEKIKHLENLLTFKNPKESLSELTDGFTDQFFTDKKDEQGIIKPLLNPRYLATSLLSNSLKLGLAKLVSNFAEKRTKKPGWKNKILGFGIVYLLPVILKKINKPTEKKSAKRKDF